MTRPSRITGVAAGVPYTALPPDHAAATAPLVVTWHLMDLPCSDAAMASALPMHGLRAWRVHLGLPMTGRRLPTGGLDEPPGIEPAPQTKSAAALDVELTKWFNTHLVAE